ncbi:hypothetical protein PHET_03154 [Paragonimus heterotremus]|uniref:DCDC1 second doublecortin-like domain-containing protein n=1 Tax=Paragonimus heterotremus TaxID=100268 RepID=A0A8J4TJ06_9TREM|nr:hypothetical protein PHET_03154 [Paragonimus heterotremus]
MLVQIVLIRNYHPVNNDRFIDMQLNAYKLHPKLLQPQLQACTMRFQLGAPVKRVFAWDGREISDFSDIPTFNSATDQGRKTGKQLGGNEQQRYLGPVWVSKGESYSPSGVYDYLGHCIGAMREKLEPLKSYKKQLEAAKEGNRNEVKQMKILSMNSSEQTKELELSEGCHFAMRHIAKISENNSLASTTGLHLKLLEQISASAAKVKPNGPAGGIAIKRLFTESGQEVFELKQLSNGDIVFISYGEGWITPKGNDDRFFVSTTWSCTDKNLTLDDELEPIPINESWSETELNENLQYVGTRERNSEDDQLSLRNFTLLQSKEHAELFAVPLVITTTKQSDHESTKPAGTQIWSVNKQGQIRPRPCFGGLTLGLILKADQVFGLADRNFQNPSKPNKKKLTGFRVALVPQNDDDAYQHWRFGVDGFIHNQGDESLVLTCLYGNKTSNEEDGLQSVERYTAVHIAACTVLSRSWDSCQRWGIKQERWSTFGQWRHSRVPNPEWHRKAFTWPVDRQGEINDSLIWPVEGFLKPFVPPLEPSRGHAGSHPARRLFDEEGTEHFSLEKLPRDTLVHVSTGGPFVNVWQAKQEQKLRAFFASVKPIVDKADNYVRLLQNMEQEWVLTVVPRLVEGATIKLQKAAPGILINSEAKLIQENYSDPKDNSEAIKQSQPQLSREYFQRFEFSEDGVLYVQADPTLALTMITSVYDKPRLLLKKRRFGEESQRFVLTKEGSIGCGEYVLSFELSDGANTTSLAGSIVAMSRPVTARFGRATQMFQYDLQSKLIYALATNLLDQNMGRRSQLSGKHPLNGAAVCVACSRQLLGRFKLTPVHSGDSFVCAFANVRESTIKELGSLGLFHGGHLDLSTYEAKWSVKYWQTRIDVNMNDLARMKRAHAELMTIVQSKPKSESVKLLVYRNGDARVLAPKLCIGSSMSGLLDHCTARLQYSTPVTQFYTADGTAVRKLEDLYAWAKEHSTEVVEQGEIWFCWCSEADQTEDTKTEITDLKYNLCHRSVDRQRSNAIFWKMLSEKSEHAAVYVGHPEVRKLMAYGILPDLKREKREKEHLTKWPTKQALDNETLPTVKLISGGEIFQVGELEGPGKIKEYEFVIKIDDVYGLLEFLPGCLLTVNEELRLVLVLVYEIFGHEVRSDVFEPNSSKLDDVTEIRIRSRLGPLKSYFTKVCPTITIKLHPVLNWQDKTGSTSSSDLKLGQPIANCVVSMESLLIVNDEADIKLSDIRAQFCHLWLLKEQLHSPRQTVYTDTELIHLFVDIDLHEGRVDVSTDQDTVVESKGDNEEIDWSITPIEVWASSGEEFVQLSDVYNDVDHVRIRAQETTMDQTCNRDNSSLSNNILEKRIFVYKNQETPSGSVLVWGESLDAILEEARVKLNCQKMPEKLCTLDGEKVIRLTDLKQDQLVCLVCSGERFVSNGMQQCEIKANWTRARKTYGSGSTEMIVQSRENPLVGVDPFDPKNTNLHNRENMQSDVKRINVYENGKPIRTAQLITGDSLNQLLERSTILLRLPQIAVCFYTRDGIKITTFQQILHEDILAVSTTGQGFLSTRMHETHQNSSQ